MLRTPHDADPRGVNLLSAAQRREEQRHLAEHIAQDVWRHRGLVARGRGTIDRDGFVKLVHCVGRYFVVFKRRNPYTKRHL